jgi:hypothetical protein
VAYQYAGHYVEALLKNTNASARLLAGIPVVIRLTDGVTLATVYEGRSKAATISNPVITDASGNLSAWLDPGSYLGFPVIEGVEQAAFPMFVGIDPVEADTPPASEVVVTPAGGITATNVQAALVELDTEKATVAALDAEAAARAAADALLVPLTQKGAADGVATLGGDGKLTAGQLPDLAISAFLGTTASEAAMLALVGQRGDWTVRTDTDPDTTWMLTADDPTLLANWRQLSTVTDAVASVNGRTGAVVGLAEAADLTAEANARALADAAEATARTVADGLKAPLASPTFTGVPSMPVVEVTGKNGLSTRRFSGRKTTTGAPTTGTWAVDDEVLDSNGTLWRCTVAGTPGTWVQSSGTIVTAPAASGDVTGVTDRNAIQAALDALGVIGTGTLYVSAGTYIFAKSAAGAWCIDVPAGVRIMWHPSAWWKLADNQPNSTSVVRIAADNVTLDHPGIDGNVDNNAVTTNQKHGIVVNGAAHTRILFPRLKNTEGDGIYLGTSSVVTDTQIFKPWCSNNKRNGITPRLDGRVVGRERLLRLQHRRFGHRRRARQLKPHVAERLGPRQPDPRQQQQRDRRHGQGIVGTVRAHQDRRQHLAGRLDRAESLQRRGREGQHDRRGEHGGPVGHPGRLRIDQHPHSGQRHHRPRRAGHLRVRCQRRNAVPHPNPRQSDQLRRVRRWRLRVDRQRRAGRGEPDHRCGRGRHPLRRLRAGRSR